MSYWPNRVAQYVVGGPYSVETLPAPDRAAMSYYDEYMDWEDSFSDRVFYRAEVPVEIMKAWVFDEGTSQESREMRADHDSFESYHQWYISGDYQRMNQPWMANCGLGERRPSLLAWDDDDSVIWDGWHRFHHYVRCGEDTIPLLVMVMPEDDPLS